MSSYKPLAGCYDQFTADVDYSRWADYLERHFRRRGLPGHTVLDLACGTGSLTWELARRGYEMIGVDQSADMLSQAANKSQDGVLVPPLFLCQSMERLDLYGTIDACVCCLDSINYVLDPKKLEKTFRRVALFLMPGGVFIFDARPPQALAALDGQVFLDETEDAYCVWRTEYSPPRRLATHFFDLFFREGDCWRREEELHRQRAYSAEELTEMLTGAGFSHIRPFGNLRLRPPGPGDDRIFLVAQKPKDS